MGGEKKAERRTQSIPLLLTKSEVQRLDSVRFATRFNGRGEAIRRLCQAGMDAVTAAPLGEARALLGFQAKPISSREPPLDPHRPSLDPHRPSTDPSAARS
jgi:hypothetical protein